MVQKGLQRVENPPKFFSIESLFPFYLLCMLILHTFAAKCPSLIKRCNTARRSSAAPNPLILNLLRMRKGSGSSAASLRPPCPKLSAAEPTPYGRNRLQGAVRKAQKKEKLPSPAWCNNLSRRIWNSKFSEFSPVSWSDTSSCHRHLFSL